jgi:5-methylcytosine-specific restriction protein A
MMVAPIPPPELRFSMSQNPDWTRDELILALDLFMDAQRKQLDSKDLRVIELSKLLNRLPLHEGQPRGSDFRNANGVSMKLGNFLRIDPSYSGKGLARGNKLEQEVWDEFADDRYRLRRVAANLRRSVEQRIAETRDVYGPVPDEEEFPEGGIHTRLHKVKERSRRVVEAKKELVLQTTGKLACEVCDFDFRATYGDIGENFAECHHRVPIAQLTPDHRTRASDLAIVCANCHRMLHKSRPMLDIDELRAIVRQNGTRSGSEHPAGRG